MQKAIAGDALHNAFNATRDKLVAFANQLEQQRDFADFKETLAHLREAVAGATTDTMIAAYLKYQYDTDECG